VAFLLLQILDERFAKALTGITSQLPVSIWHEYIDEATLADARYDRLNPMLREQNSREIVQKRKNN
jgi:hypothetical protein